MNQATFFAEVRTTLFGGTLKQWQVDGINSIFAAWDSYGDGDKNKLAYVLATTKWETASTMQPVEEYGHGAGHPYGLPAGPWHKVYDGRGDVQLTWEANYIKATVELHKRGLFLDVDLDKNPELATRPDIAAAVLVIGMLEGWFTGRKLADYFTAKGTNFSGARTIVNGTDHAADIASLAAKFVVALNKAAYDGRALPAPVPATEPAPVAVAAPATQPQWGLAGLALAAVNAIFPRKAA